MSEIEAPARLLGQWQFSLRSLLYVTTATTMLLLFHLRDPDVSGVYAISFFAATAWIAILSVLAGAKSPLRYGMLGGAICVGGSHSLIWMIMLSDSAVRNEVQGVVGFFVVGSLLAVNLCVLLLNPARQDAPETINDTIRRRAAQQSLAMLGVLLFVSLWPNGNYRHAYGVFVLSIILFAMALVPWLIAWRRRRLAGRVLPITVVDRCAHWLAIGSIVFAVVSAVAAAIVAFWILAGWDRLGAVVIGCGAQALAGILFVVSIVIQWYRDHWQWRTIVVAVIYALLVTAVLLFRF